MVGPPRATAADFEMPRLRRSPFDLDDMVWEARVDGGMDGYVWKVRFAGAEGPRVIKVVSGPRETKGKKLASFIDPRLRRSSSGTPSLSTFPPTMPHSENVKIPLSSR